MPKPFTPFQWEPQLSMKDHLSIIDYLKTRLRQKTISLKWQEPSMTFLEGLFARGDERLMPVLLDASKNGAYLDAWGDKLNLNIWTDALERHSIDPTLYFMERDTEKPLPWDFIDMRIDKSFLLEERNRAYQGTHTSDCRYDVCSNCGACAGDTKNLIRPKAETVRIFEQSEKSKDHYFYTIGIAKQGNLRFIGARQWAEMVKRALRRADLPVHYSEGFSPDIKITFTPPISFGIPSSSEYFQIDLKEHLGRQEIIERLKPHLEVFACEETKLRQVAAYVFSLDKPITATIDPDSMVKKGEDSLRIGDFLEEFDGTTMKIRFINGKTISPALILDAVSAKVAAHEITKIETVFADV
jgi:radical SAM-linked protein